MNVIFLDSDTLPVPLRRPDWATGWTLRPLTAERELAEVAADADMVITNKVPLNRAALEQLPRLRYVGVAATGYDIIDVAACREHGVVVSNVPAYSTGSVAEAVIASIFALRRQLLNYRERARRQWTESPYFCVYAEPIQDVAGSTLGLIGRGAIGTATARLAEAVGMQVIVAERRGATCIRDGYLPFETVLERSDILSLHCPLTDDTRSLMSDAELARMKPGALLINTARGALVDADALLRALHSGRLGGAAIDVLDREPPAADHPLLRSEHPNLIVTPHVAWASRSSLHRLAERIVDNLDAFAAGRPINVVS